MRPLRRRRSPACELSVVPTTPTTSTAMAEPSPWATRWACPVRALREPQSKNCGAVRVDTDWPRCAWGLGKEPRWHSNELEQARGWARFQWHARAATLPNQGGTQFCTVEFKRMSKLSFEARDGIAILKLDNPPVNSLGHELREALVAGLERANADPGIKALVLIGSGTGFSGGADIREFGTPRAVAHPNLRTVISEIEGSIKPVIAAVGGVCMGGGLELALACHYRVGAPGARIALPEVKLGLLPGAGGTQRLPRLLGVEPALNMIASGATIASEKLRDTPLFDAFADGDLLESALKFARRARAEGLERKRVRDLKLDVPNAEAFFQFARNTVKAVAGPYPPPPARVRAGPPAVAKALHPGPQQGGGLLPPVVLSPPAAAPRHVF